MRAERTPRVRGVHEGPWCTLGVHVAHFLFVGSEVHRDRGPVLPTLFSLFDVRSEEAALAALTGGNGRVKFKRIATLNDAAALVRDGRI